MTQTIILFSNVVRVKRRQWGSKNKCAFCDDCSHGTTKEHLTSSQRQRE